MRLFLEGRILPIRAGVTLGTGNDLCELCVEVWSLVVNNKPSILGDRSGKGG